MPTDAGRLLTLFQSGALRRPSAEHPNTVALALALAAIGGAPVESDAQAERISDLIGEPRHVVFVLADGLGRNLVERLPPDAFLRRHLALRMGSVFPSSTAPALTSLATGEWPASHSVPAWFTWLPETALTGIVLPFVDRVQGRDLATLGVTPASVFPAAVLASRLHRDFVALFPSRITGSVYSRYITGGHGGHAYDSIEGAVGLIVRRVLQALAPTYTYLYVPDVDAAEHEHGVESWQAAVQVHRLDREMARLRAALPTDARLVLSADHGQVTVPQAATVVLRDRDPLRALLRVWPPAGEPRAVSFHVVPGRHAEFEAAFRGRFGEGFTLLSVDEAEGLRLFGPSLLASTARARLGDYLAVPTGTGAIVYAGEPGVMAMRGMHGGLAPDEVSIPLILA